MIPIGETVDGRADMTNFEMDLFDTRMNSYNLEKQERADCCKNTYIKPACIPITIISVFIFVVIFFPLIQEDILDSMKTYEKVGYCSDNCTFHYVESIPTGLIYPSGQWPVQPSTFDTWQYLLNNAKHSIKLAVFYWNLRDSTGYPTSWQGNATFNGLISAARRGVSIEIAQNLGNGQFDNADSAYLNKHGLAKVKELGVAFYNCSCLADDLGKVFSVYWEMGRDDARVPDVWPLTLRTKFNANNPLPVTLNTSESRVFISSSPPRFSPKGRQDDISAIVRIIGNASEFVHVAVMDYMPATLYLGKKNYFWPLIDDAFRSAAYRGVHVKLLMSKWNHTRKAIMPFLKSLLDINSGLPGGRRKGSIQVKLFQVPATPAQAAIPFARVNHNKYMVTESVSYVGTSNWAGDYFVNTGGVAFVLNGTNTSSNNASPFVAKLNDIFLRDWSSQYAHTFDSSAH